MIGQIIQGIAGGIIYSLTGYANKKEKEGFNFNKMWPTLVVSAIIGAIAGATNQDFGIVANTTMITGCTVVVEKLGKWIFKIK